MGNPDNTEPFKFLINQFTARQGCEIHFRGTRDFSTGVNWKAHNPSHHSAVVMRQFVRKGEREREWGTVLTVNYVLAFSNGSNYS